MDLPSGRDGRRGGHHRISQDQAAIDPIERARIGRDRESVVAGGLDLPHALDQPMQHRDPVLPGAARSSSLVSVTACRSHELAGDGSLNQSL